MDSTIRIPGSLSVSLLYIFAGCEPPPPPPPPEEGEATNLIDT